MAEPLMTLDSREGLLRAVAHEAGLFARERFLGRTAGEMTMKGPQDYLTESDAAVERLIRERIARAFPDDALLGEEDGLSGTGDWVWIVDPIDGTANFAHGNPHFCVSIACMHAGVVELASIEAPLLSESFFARRGHGATLNDSPMRVSGLNDMNRAVFELGWSRRTTTESYTSLLTRVVESGATFMRRGSGALGMAHVAAGRLQGYCELHINSWDTAAGLLLVTEAGGWVNDFFAGEGLTRGNAVIGVAPGVRDAFIAVTGVS